MNLDGRQFRLVSAQGNSDLSDSVIFKYFQHGPWIWGTYFSKEVDRGTLLGRFTAENAIAFTYCHWSGGQKRKGQCKSIIDSDEGGALRIQENWTWTEGGLGSGTSVIEEIYE
ncbi:MAG: hypothetical protein KTR24_01225 [Saprospiraceae bacterium]|nr:hypothetical protein [Saprospiraceae bacterium]